MTRMIRTKTHSGKHSVSVGAVLKCLLGNASVSRVEKPNRERLESDVRALCERADYGAAATLAIRGYGPELFGFLIAVLRDEGEANEAFSELCEVLWRGLPAFAWESTLRTWAYGIARNMSRTRRRNAARRARRVAGGESALEEIAQAVRSQTLSYLRTEKKTRLQALRDRLSEDDRVLLVLRIDRQLDWKDLARVLGETQGSAPLDEAALAREAARLRKRFQVLKDRIRELAKRENLVE
jgi:RNA polymerase sigma-70 factor, ECF subfamily